VSEVEYPPVQDYEDDGTMPQNVQDFAKEIVGHRIVKVERPGVIRGSAWWSDTPREHSAEVVFTLDDGRKVALVAGGDCCAYTNLEEIIEHLPTVDHIITAVRPDENYETWHIVADLGDVLELKVGWSAGNPFYYGYGFDIIVQKEEA
jgi:hypothetical protein